ncbi:MULTISPECIES: hypothetical protein [unclassified Spiroplasma]|uniref:hypothetical protein n=1 Tax=unclassified Spiroplasma TaxID=2637901 RepID=UPI00313BD555
MFLDFAKEVLKVKKQSLTVEEIWNFGNELKFTNLINEMKKMSKTPISKLSIILINDIQNNPHSNFISDVNYQKFSLQQHFMDNVSKNVIKNEQYLAEQVNNIEKENITKILNEKESKNMDNSNNNIFLCLANRVIKMKGKPLTAEEIWNFGNELKVTNAINNTHLKDMSPILRIAIALNTDIVNNPHSNFM